MSEPSILESMPTDLAERADWLNDIMVDRAPRWPGRLPNERQVDYLISVVRHAEPPDRQREVSDAARELLARCIIANRDWEAPDLDRLHEILGVLESLPGSSATGALLYDLTRLSVLDATRHGISLRRQAFRALALADPPPGWRREHLIDEWRDLIGDPHITVAAFAGLRSLDLLAAVKELPRFLMVAGEAGIAPAGSLSVLCQMVESDAAALKLLGSVVASLSAKKASRVRDILRQCVGADWRYPKVWAAVNEARATLPPRHDNRQEWKTVVPVPPTRHGGGKTRRAALIEGPLLMPAAAVPAGIAAASV